MDTKRLHYYCTIVEQGQISKAAQVLNISQPPLSMRLKELEDELGTVLIVRDQKRWQVTEAGRLLYERARQILDSLERTRSEVQDAAEGLFGQVSIGISTTCQHHLLPVLPAINKNYPGIRFRIAVLDSSFLEDKLHRQVIDMALLLLPLEKEDYIIHQLPEGSFSVVFSKDLKLPPGEGPVTLEDLRDMPLLLSRRWHGSGNYEALMKYFQQKDITPHVLLDCHNVPTLLRMIELGLTGATIVPSTEVPLSISSRFPVRRLQARDITIHPVLVHLKSHFMTSTAQIVIRAVLEHAWSKEHG